MILVDTSVLVEYLRTANPVIRQVLQDQPAVISGIIRAEILHGARSDADYRRLITMLDGFPRADLDITDWDDVGRHLASLRRVGLTVPFQDAAIATLAIRDGLDLWAYDAHFPLIQKSLPALRLFVEPPPP